MTWWIGAALAGLVCTGAGYLCAAAIADAVENPPHPVVVLAILLGVPLVCGALGAFLAATVL